MPTYKVRIKPGRHYGVARHQGGDVIEVSESEVQLAGDFFEVLEEIPEDAPQAEPPSAEEQVIDAQTAALVAKLEEVLGESVVDDEVDVPTLEELQSRMRQGDVPKIDEVVGKATAARLADAGMDDPIVLYYATDGDITRIKGIGPGKLKMIRDVYGKA